MSSDRRLPEDPAYWDDLAARSVEAAFRSSAMPAGASRASHAARDPWWRGMSDAAFVLAASAVLALIGGSLILDERPPRATTDARALTAVLAPDDPLLGSLLNASAEPPPAFALLKLVALREEER